MSLIRDRALRPLGWTVVGTVVAYFVLGGKSYYALPVIVFAFAAGAPPLDRWIARRPRRLLKASVAFAGRASGPPRLHSRCSRCPRPLSTAS